MPTLVNGGRRRRAFRVPRGHPDGAPGRPRGELPRGNGGPPRADSSDRRATLFIPDDDLAAMTPFLGPHGRITGRQFDKPELERSRDKAYELRTRHIAERLRLIPYLEATDGGAHAAIGSQAAALHSTPTHPRR